MVICLEQIANYLHMVQPMPLPHFVSCFIKVENGFAFLVLAYPGCPGKEAIKRVSVCPLRSVICRSVACIEIDRFTDRLGLDID